MDKTRRNRFKVLDDGKPGPEGDSKVEHLGAEMRRARVEKGLSVSFLAETLRIRESYLVAIEEGHFDRLPGPAYALGFVRSYANYLGLDGREMVQRFKDEAGNQQRMGRSGRLAFPSPLAEGRGSFGALLILALALGAVVYAGWYWYSNREPGQLGLDTPQSAPARSGALSGAREAAPTVAPSASVAVPLGAPERSSPPSLAPQGGETAPAGSATGAGSAGTGAGSTGAAALGTGAAGTSAQGAPAGQSATGGASDAQGGLSGVVILAKRDSWIQVRDDAGTMLTSSVLRAGETYRVPNRPGLMLMTGNAGGIEIVVDGRTLPPLGAEGTIRRDVSLDRDKLQGTAP